MSTFTVELEIPAELRGLGCTPEELRREVPILLVLKRFREGTISSGKGAELLGMTRRQFLELLAREKLPAFDASDDELADQFQTVERLASLKQ